MPPDALSSATAATSSIVVVADVPPGRGRSPAYDVGLALGTVGTIALFAWLIVRGVRGSKAERGAPRDDPPPPAR
ncbi:MAG: hypothetical protein JNM10_18210 [Planctomycetia bacterium]|nr:hypothetical protein [Planctomycetia bacterium]